MLHLTVSILLCSAACSHTARPWRVLVTGYCPCPICCGSHAAAITASGIPAEGKLVAAPKAVSFGTEIYVPGYSPQPVPVLDRGGAIRGNGLDAFFPTHQEALRWGRRWITVWIIRR
jgi:3D (Asp-Asp-Asp) domain-containing protein